SNLPRTLAANGFTHMLVRRGGPYWHSADRQAPDGFRVAARFDDARVLAVAQQTPTIQTSAMRGLFPREHDREWSWRWMGAEMRWTIVNTGAQPIVGDLEVEASAFDHPRTMEVRLDGQLVQTLVVEPS